MSENKHIQIPKQIATNDELDYAFLRKKGLEHIERLAGDLWTDYNSHDPGITILEMLSYAITDLGARINLRIEHLLAPEDANAQKLNEQFFGATEILSSKPVTETDYRKLFIDIQGVKNCWLKPFRKTVFVDCKHDNLAYSSSKLKTETGSFDLQGLYSVLVDFDDFDTSKFGTDELKKKEETRIIDEITARYHANRNLCEDLVEVEKVKTHPISVCASIEVDSEADEELVHAQVLRGIDTYFSPALFFHSLQQMFENGYLTEEIFDGPILENGFLDPEELWSTQLRTEVRLSDLINVIMNIEGVLAVRDISISDCTKEQQEPDIWLIAVQNGKKPSRCAESAFSYYKGILPVNINKKRVDYWSDELEKAEKKVQEEARFQKNLDFPVGKFLGTSETTTIQNDFPETYGIGQVGLSSNADSARKAQAKQLKAYLLFFDQILAGYFAHLGKVKDSLSVDSKLKQTYFTQVVKDIKGFEELVSDYDTSSNEILASKILSKLDNNIKRKNILLDHLIARFAEKFSDYAFLMKQFYGSYAEKAILESKETFLSEYGEITAQNGKIINKGISNWRGSAFNYFNQKPEDLWNAINVSGVQKRIARLAGIRDYSRRNLADTFTEVYELVVDSEGNKVYRWNITNQANKIILSTARDFKSRSSAANEMYKAVVKIIETPESAINEAFKNPLTNKQEIGNFMVHVFPGTSLMFSIIDPDLPEDNPKRIIARHINIYSSPEQLKKIMLTLLTFITTDFTEEGMFVVEHILLRPDVTKMDNPLTHFLPICTDNCTSCTPADPYSFRVTVVLPGWTYRFSNRSFRRFMEELIRKELPAHILARICWPGYPDTNDEEPENDMVNFDETYKAFLLSITNTGKTKDSNILRAFIKVLSELNSIYPTGKLIDCSDETDALEGRIVLGSTNLGNV